MEKLTKKQYVTPTLKEHGVMRELTQTGSGGRPEHGKHKRRHRGKKLWWRWWRWW